MHVPLDVRVHACCAGGEGFGLGFDVDGADARDDEWVEDVCGVGALVAAGFGFAFGFVVDGDGAAVTFTDIDGEGIDAVAEVGAVEVCVLAAVVGPQPASATTPAKTTTQRAGLVETRAHRTGPRDSGALTDRDGTPDRAPLV